ncbi:hypothetical protein BDD12DRAFT_877537 [Trichophaea hybrida]|nr:hypothetical protein BDD12DRAFT_877537 [Trichophaea hybrida]
MHFQLPTATILSIIGFLSFFFFAGTTLAAPAASIKARQNIVTFGDDGRPSMSGTGGSVVPYSNTG